MPVSLQLDQKWHLDSNAYGSYPLPKPVGEIYNPTFNPGYIFARSSGDYFKSCFPYCGTGYEDGYCKWNKSLTRLTFVASDGTQYELRDQLTNGKPLEPDCANLLQGPLRGKVFVTADGTSATFISDTDIYDISDGSMDYGVSGYMKMRDGTTYRVEGAIKWARDKNGNMLKFEYAPYGTYDPAWGGLYPLQYQGVILSKITDSLNREVTFTYNVTDPQHGLCTKITYQGFEPTPRTIYITYAPLQSVLRADATLKTYRQLFPMSTATFAEINLDTLFNANRAAAVILPDGRSYQFRYNSYGELARVVLPTGGSIQYEFAHGLTPGVIPSGAPQYHWEYPAYRRLVERRDSTGSVLTISRPEAGTYVLNGSYNWVYS